MKFGQARGPVYRQAKVCMKIRGLSLESQFSCGFLFVMSLFPACPDQSWAELVKKAGKVDEKQVGIAILTNGIMVEHGGTAHDKLILSESP